MAAAEPPSPARPAAPTTQLTPPNRWLTLSLLVAFLLMAVTGTPPHAVVFHLFVVGGLLFASLRWPVGRLAIIALLVAGVDMRLAHMGAGSDVLIVTRAAIDLVLAGGNPYGIGYPVSMPPGAPYPYGPLALLWYMPAASPKAIEMGVAVAILVLLALRGRLLGLAIYATMPALIVIAGDGANDTSLGLLLLVGLASLPRLPWLGAFVVGLAIAFKPSALAWAPPLVAWAGLPGLIALAVGAALFWLPAAIAWSPAAILDSFRRASETHQVSTYYSLAYAVQRWGVTLPAAPLEAFRLLLGAAVAVVAMVRVRSADGVIVWGLLIYLVTLFAGFWSTIAYFAAVGPILCWHVDRWLGGADSRVRWPGDPVGRLTAALDARRPALESGLQWRKR